MLCLLMTFTKGNIAVCPRMHIPHIITTIACTVETNQNSTELLILTDRLLSDLNFPGSKRFLRFASSDVLSSAKLLKLFFAVI